jgi:FkbM family methyltransferase
MLMSLSDSTTDVLVAPMDPPLTIIDIGARGGLDAAWTPLLPHLRAYGFEADPEESERLAGEHGSLQVKFVPLALGAAPGAVDLHVATDPACSSLYAPDELLPGRYRALAEIAATGRRSITVDTLDRWAEREGVTDVSYLKLDTQGSELDILRGASRTLRTVCAVRTEVEFNPIYENQPLFADVDTFLREQGFVLWRLTNLCHYTLGGHDEGYPFPDRQMFAARPRDGTTVEFVGGGGRLFWADAYFVRQDLAEGRRPADPGTATRAACVLSTLGFHDVAAICR